ncbi:MAG: CPBP family intramembrane metalloprotease [Anaerolineales bacterium]|jgi:hypothetical protein
MMSVSPIENSRFLSKYQLILFFVLTYLLSWWSALLPQLNGSIMPHGPAFAAVIIIALWHGKQGLREFWKRLSHWRGGYWYLVGPAIILGYQGIAFVINSLFGASIADYPQLLNMGTVLMLFLFGGQWEEIGWTGFALPKLQEQLKNRSNGQLIAAVVLGVFRAVWHFPLFLQGKVYWFDLLFFEIAIQIIIAWLYNQSGGSVLVVMVFHYISNLFGAVMLPVFTGSDRTSYYAWFMGLAVLISFVIAWKTQFTLKLSKQTN